MLRRALMTLILAGSMIACGDPNPILGVWVVDPREGTIGSEAAAVVAGRERIEFREDKRITGNRSVDVRYEVAGDRVIVTDAREGEGVVYRILGPEHIERDMGLGIVVVYRREGTSRAPVASGGQPGR